MSVRNVGRILLSLAIAMFVCALFMHVRFMQWLDLGAGADFGVIGIGYTHVGRVLICLFLSFAFGTLALALKVRYSLPVVAVAGLAMLLYVLDFVLGVTSILTIL